MHNLTGTWLGQFSYPTSRGATFFVLRLQDSAGKLTGETEEPDQLLRDGSAQATVTGFTANCLVDFTKTHPVSEVTFAHRWTTLDGFPRQGTRWRGSGACLP
jgi:hypothetical protein